MGDHRARTRRELPNLRSLWLRRPRWTFRRKPEPDPPYRTTWATLRDRDGHQAYACTWSDGSLTIEGLLGPPSSPDGRRFEYSYRVGADVMRGFVDGLGSPRWTELVRVLAACGDDILDHGAMPLAEVLDIQSFGREDVLTDGGPGSWLARRGVPYSFGWAGFSHHHHVIPSRYP